MIETGRMLGVGATIGLVVLTGMAGAWLARNQGLELLRKIQDETARGHMPAITLIEGALVLIGGLLLLTPGFFTDLLGFSFLVPLTRDMWRTALSAWLEKQLKQGAVSIHRY